MGRRVYVVGHKFPDTDAICAALAYTHLMRAMGTEEAVAARQGDPRRDTEYLLDRFSVPPPMYIRDVRARVDDLMSPTIAVNREDSLYDVGRILQERDLPALPVVDDDGRLCGLIDMESFATLFMGGVGTSVSEEIPPVLGNVVPALGGQLLVEGKGRKQWDKVFIATMSLESMVQRIEPDSLMVIGDPSIPVRHIMSTDVLTAEADELLEEARPLLARQPLLPVVDPEGKVAGAVSRSSILRPARERVVLVDHNERSQSVEGLEEAEIVGVIDHHRVYDVRTDAPIFMRFEPLGSCNTIIYKLFRENLVQIPRPIAGIMLGAILTDTILFKSPTSTSDDRMAGEVLAERAGVDIDELGTAVLSAASDVAGKQPRELVLGDFKEFALGDMRFGVSSVETINAGAAAAMRERLLEELRALREARQYASVLMMIMDIAHERTEVLVEGHEPEVAQALGRPLENGHRVEIPGILSRKKQVVPLLPSIRDAIVRRGG